MSEIFVVDSREPDLHHVEQAADLLRRGGVVAYPTETFYGLAVDPRSEPAVSRLFEVKGRNPTSPIALIAASMAEAEAAGMFGPAERRLAAEFWPGPLTLVVPRTPAVSPQLAPDTGTIGIRVTSHPVAVALARAFGWCITATSANLSGRPPATTAGEVAAALGDRIDAVIDGGPTPGGPPSSVVEIAGGKPTLHRVGAIAWDRVLESLE